MLLVLLLLQLNITYVIKVVVVTYQCTYIGRLQSKTKYVKIIRNQDSVRTHKGLFSSRS